MLGQCFGGERKIIKYLLNFRILRSGILNYIGGERKITKHLLNFRILRSGILNYIETLHSPNVKLRYRKDDV